MKSMNEKIENIDERQSQLDETKAEILLNQSKIRAMLSEIDEFQAEILLQGLNQK